MDLRPEFPLVPALPDEELYWPFICYVPNYRLSTVLYCII